MITIIISMIAAAIVAFHGIFSVINHMSPCTPTGMRVAWILVTVGSTGMLLAPLFGTRQPSVWEAALLSGVAAYVVFDRRKRKTYCVRSSNDGP